MMDYNTSRNLLIFKEYGRNIQRLVEHASEIEDFEKRQQVADYIIDLMGQMNPHLRNVEQFRHKLWDHLFMISKFKLEVDSPYPLIEPEDVNPTPEPLEYPKNRLRFRHYGKNVETLVKKAVEMEDPDKQYEFSRVIGNYMKMVYRNWNNESVDDEQIREDLLLLSEGQLKLDSESNLDRLSRSNRNKRKKPTNNYSNNNNNNGRRHYGSNNNNNSNYYKKKRK